MGFLKKIAVGALSIVLSLFVMGLIMGGFFALFAPKPHPLAPAQEVYVGVWNNASGNILTIQKDGLGAYQSPTMSISGGGVSFGPNTLDIRFAFIGKTFTITAPPQQAGDGSFSMALNNDVYRKAGDAVVLSPSLTPGLASARNKVFLQKFCEALRTNDISPLHDAMAQMFKAQISKEKFRTMLDAFFTNASAALPVFQDTLAVWPAEATLAPVKNDDEATVILAENTISASGHVVSVKIKYIQENNQFMPVGFAADIANPHPVP